MCKLDLFIKTLYCVQGVYAGTVLKLRTRLIFKKNR